MKHLPSALTRWACLCALLALLAACGSNAAALPIATVTPLATAEQDAAPALPTSTPAKEQEIIAQLPDVIEARKKLQEGSYESAITLLTRVYATRRDNREAQDLLGGAYLSWGQQILAESGADPAKVSQALDKFTDGLAVVEGGQVHDDLEEQAGQTRAFLGLVAAQQELDVNGASEVAVRKELADKLLAQLGQFEQQRADYPGLARLYANGLVATAAVYEAEAAGYKGEAKIPTLQQALGYCEQALEREAEHVPGKTCLDRVAVAIRRARTPPTPTPAPPPPARLSVILLNRDDTPSCVSMQIQGVAAGGWVFSLDGLGRSAAFDGAGNTRICGLRDRQEFTFSILSGGRAVPGGSGIPARGGDIFIGRWR